jgi:hypothetical protein
MPLITINLMIRRDETMKNANVGSKKIDKAAQPRRVAGVPVRSGVKAGFVDRDPRQRFTSPYDRGL